MKAFFHRLIRELKGSLTGCGRALDEGREDLDAFTRRHPDWKYTALGCLLFPPFLVIGAGLTLVGLMRASAHDT